MYDEADQQVQLGMRMLTEAGIVANGVLLRARREASAAVVPSAPPVCMSASEAPLIGRDREWSTLAAALNTSATGQAQVILLRGDPGMGKSRLLDCPAQPAVQYLVRQA